MTNVNKLQLVDVGKLNAILEMFKKENETKKIFDSIKNPDFLSIEEKKKNMEKIDARQNENIVEFLKKKNSRKNEYDIQEKKKKKKKKKIQIQIQIQKKKGKDCKQHNIPVIFNNNIPKGYLIFLKKKNSV